MVIEGGYLRDILAQPAALADTLAGLDPPTLNDAVKRYREGRFDRAILTGMGGSYWALHPLYLSLVKGGGNAVLVETSELIYFLPELLDSRTLLIVCSQSGRSAEVVRLLDVKHADCFALAVTNTPDSPLAQRADSVVLTRAGEEFTVSSKTYVAALMALKWVGDALAGAGWDQSRDELSHAAPAVAEYLRDWREHVRAAEAELSGVRDVFVLGRGSSLAAAGAAGLIIKESTHLHGEGMSAAAFRHGPWEMINPALYALVLAGDEAGGGLAERLVRDIVEEGGRAALFRGPRVHASVRPIAEILPVEMLTLALASLAGREAGRFERATKITTTE